MTITTLSVGAAVTPAVVKTCLSHYANRKPRHRKPTAHISYDEGLHLIRSFLTYASHQPVEELQAFTANLVPHPPWVRTEPVTIPAALITKAADAIIANLGEDGVQQIGGRKWWQWRRIATPLKAEWIEMRADSNERKRTQSKSRRVMLYVHGGGYFFGSVDEHRYQMQRHARKLQARVIAPRYRLAPQFPFPCGLQDCLAVYLHLLTVNDATEIILAGDSAGGGMIISLLCLLRDQGLPLPAGAVLISPWVDLTHSFPSVAGENPMDYIPPHGFHHTPSASWPPLNENDLEEMERSRTIKQGREEAFVEKAKELAQKLGEKAAFEGFEETQHVDAIPRQHHHLSVEIDGKPIKIKDQTQMYTTNQLLAHPLVSPIMQPSLGGLPPMLILTGGGEVLRDEQIYLAHKAAHPSKYPLGPQYRSRYDPDDIALNKYKPTPVQLQVWEDLCHVAPTLSFTRPAKYMYRSIAQFGAWALSRAQNRPIEIVDDDDISVVSSGSAESSAAESANSVSKQKHQQVAEPKSVGKAGDPLPMFKNHMIRQRVDRYGNIFALAPANELPATMMDPSEIGVIKAGPVKKWMEVNRQYNVRYASAKRKAHRQRLEHLASGTSLGFGPDEHPPPSALAGRRTAKDELVPKVRRSHGLAMWSGWGSKHDERTIKREEQAAQEGAKAQPLEKRQVDGERDTRPAVTINEPAWKASRSKSRSRSRATSGSKRQSDPDRSLSRRRTISVTNQGQADASMHDLIDETTPVPAINTVPDSASSSAHLPAEGNASATPPATATSDHLSPVLIPKFKAAPHLRNTSKAIDSDAASTMTGQSMMSLPDNASTTAVFSVAGVSKPTTDDRPPTPEVHVDGGDGASEAKSVSDKASTICQEGKPLDGDDTPISRRSLERLQTNNAVGATPSETASLRTGSVHSEKLRTRLGLLRSSSTTAVVKAPGVVDIVEGSEADKGNEGESVNGIGTSERPGMYDRQDTEFKTASEML